MMLEPGVILEVLFLEPGQPIRQLKVVRVTRQDLLVTVICENKEEPEAVESTQSSEKKPI